MIQKVNDMMSALVTCIGMTLSALISWLGVTPEEWIVRLTIVSLVLGISHYLYNWYTTIRGSKGD